MITTGLLLSRFGSFAARAEGSEKIVLLKVSIFLVNGKYSISAIYFQALLSSKNAHKFMLLGSQLCFNRSTNVMIGFFILIVRIISLELKFVLSKVQFQLP